MPYESNAETQQALSQEIKALKKSCLETCHVIENCPPDDVGITLDNVSQKSVAYIEGLRTEIENSNTPIVQDDNLLTSQALSDIKRKTAEVEELIAFTRGSIQDVEIEIERLNNHIKVAQEAKSRPQVEKHPVQAEHIHKAKECFQQMKSDLHSLIGSLFPDRADAMKDFLGMLMSERLNENSSGYLPITTENFTLVELLREMNIVTTNPYNNMEAKLAF